MVTYLSDVFFLPNKLVDIFFVRLPELRVLSPVLVVVHEELEPVVELRLRVPEKEKSERGNDTVVIVGSGG